MAISGAASKVAKKFQNSKINKKLTKKLDDVTSSLKSKTKNITANIAKKTKEATQKVVNTVSDKAKTIANKTLSGTNTVKNAINNVPKSAKNKVASVIDSLGEGILTVQNTFALGEIAKTKYGQVVVKKIKTGFGQSGEETLSQLLSKDVKKLKNMFFSQGNKRGGTTTVTHRGTNENIAKKLQQGYLPANYPNPNNAVTRAIDHSKPAVWVSEGKPNLFNRIFSGMVGKRGEASITFEVDSSLLKKPNGLIKRFFGKAQRVIEADVPIPDDVIIKWGGGKE